MDSLMIHHDLMKLMITGCKYCRADAYRTFLACMSMYCNENCGRHIMIDKVSEKTGRSIETVRKHLKQLEKVSFISISNKRSKSGKFKKSKYILKRTDLVMLPEENLYS